ncbi:MAG: tetratricopeptide repeat protein [Chlamydiales bacterium]|nr:tetratricopeptide repeat protein [Chlamydiales bacterium]
MRKPKNLSKLPLFVYTTLACFPLYGHAEKTAPSASLIEDQEEAFLVRRIAEFWKDQDFQLVKKQIEEFLSSHPSSKMNDQLRGLYADLLLQESAYEKALDVYQQIKQTDVLEKIIINKLQCYYELNQFDKIYKEGESYLYSQKSCIVERKTELNFLIAESLFRESLKESTPATKKKLASQSKDIYENLLNSPFKEQSEFALAEIYTLIENYPQAAKLYGDLAKTHPDKQEDLLFQAATAQAKYDKVAAIQTFGEVVHLKGNKQHEALFNQIVLLFQNNQFAEVIQLQSQLVLGISDEHKPTLEYIAGRSCFGIEDYATAEIHLSKYVKVAPVGSLQHKNALLMLLSCAQKLNNNILFDQTIADLNTNYKDADELKQALFIHAMLLKNKGDFISAQQELESIMKNYPNFEDQESLILEYGLITHENKDWKTSYTSLKTYLNSYPQGKQRSIAWKCFLSTAVNYLKTADQKTSYTKAEFYTDLAATLQAQEKSGNILSVSEEKDCRLLFAKTAYDLDKYDITLKSLTQYIVAYENDPSLGEAHFLMGLCYQKASADPAKFYEHTEKAIEINPELNDSSSVHLQLYNAYLTKANELNGKNKDASVLIEKAATHLYFVIAKGDVDIKLQNKLWLASHYYNRVKSQNLAYTTDEFTRAVSIYEQALIQHQTQNILDIDEQSLYLESEVIKFTELLSQNNQLSFKINVLKDLVSQQHQKQSLDWKLKKQTLLELGKAYEAANQDRDALETYAFITKQFNSFNSYAVDYAKLHQARLQFKLFNASSMSPEDAAYVLSLLKDLQIKKSADTEPLHLEAAIDYAKLRTSLAATNEKDTRYLFFLTRLKEDFEASSDVTTVEYQKELQQNVAKKATYDLYMQYVDAEIVRSNAKIEHKANRLSYAEELNSQALSKFAEIKNQPNLTDYLQTQIERSIYEIDNINSY